MPAALPEKPADSPDGALTPTGEPGNVLPIPAAADRDLAGPPHASPHMARARDDDYDDRDDDYDDRPPPRRRRRDRDDDDDDHDRPVAKGPLDGMFANTNIVVLVLFALCCRGLAFILAAICYFTAKDPKAKSNATLVLVIDAVLIIVGVILNVTGALAGLGAGRAGNP